MQNYSTALLALKQGTEVFCFRDTDRKITFGPVGMGVITWEVPTVLIRGGSHCFQPETVTVISIKTMMTILRNENPGYLYNMSGVIEEFGFLYKRKSPNYVDFLLPKNELKLVDIIIHPHLSEIKVIDPNFPKTEILSFANWHNWFVNIAVLDYGLVCANIALGK